MALGGYCDHLGHVILLCFRYSDIISVVQAVECHPDPDVRKHCFIGMFVVVLITLNLLQSERPKLHRV